MPENRPLSPRREPGTIAARDTGRTRGASPLPTRCHWPGNSRPRSTRPMSVPPARTESPGAGQEDSAARWAGGRRDFPPQPGAVRSPARAAAGGARVTNRVPPLRRGAGLAGGAEGSSGHLSRRPLSPERLSGGPLASGHPFHADAGFASGPTEQTASVWGLRGEGWPIVPRPLLSPTSPAAPPALPVTPLPVLQMCCGRCASHT